MSKEEERVRQTLEPLVLGQPTLLAKAVREPLVHWITMKLMVLDRSPRSGVVFLPQERAAFYQDRTVPKTLSIWLLQSGDRDWRTAYRSIERSASNTPERPTYHMPNVKMFLWGLGHLVVCAFYRREIEISFELKDDKAVKIWPSPPLARGWPQARLSAEEVEGMGQTFEKLDQQAGVHWAPED